MKNQILNIIQNNASGSTEAFTDGLMHHIASQEITSHVFEFIQWLTDHHEHDGDIERGYQYWKDNVKDK